MKKSNLNLMKKGWYIGNFEPTLIKTNEFEAAIKEYKKGDKEDAHFHKIATEITIVVSGKIKMFDQVFEKNDIIIVEPGDITSFEALDDSITSVIKYPGVSDDKYLVGEQI